MCGCGLIITSDILYAAHRTFFFPILWKILIRFNISVIKISKQQHIFFIYSKTQSVGFQEAHSKCHPRTDIPKSHHAPSNCRGFSWVGEESVKLIICCAKTHSSRFQEEATVGSLINMFFFPQVDKPLIHVLYQHVFHSGPPVPTLQHTQNVLCVCARGWVAGWLGVSRLHACSEMHSC